MSIPVALDRLAQEVARFALAPYLLSVTAAGRPHAVATSVSWSEGAWIARVGRRTAANLRERADVTLLWTPSEPGGYSLIVDGRAVLEGEGDEIAARITPASGVLHRPAAAPLPAGSSCTADCVPLLR